ncbi:NADPH-dependent FMN reductase [Natrinema ejinorense]|uniref:NADPH-dependent FMN reductase-like domain-containing protein n=1 Tax=Natrinema ejinorense TaxID=373386 RepID=A0A2A5QQ58_9EURY|nr:NAD(P)H-dependent oxidoreductase [Natrinema ejinorense]PCR88998.1 hypothetical protein CP557_21255 [Natrinema ejinorense]
MGGSSKRNVVALCGSLRDESKTRIVLTEVLEAAQEEGATTELIDLRSYELPSLYATESPTPDAKALQKTVDAADSVLLGTPNYHGSFSGSLKNALDYCGRDEFAGTTVGLVEVAAGDFPGSALMHLRTVARTLHAWTLPTEVAIPNSHSMVGTDGINDEELTSRARKLGRELTIFAGIADYVASTPTPNA